MKKGINIDKMLHDMEFEEKLKKYSSKEKSPFEEKAYSKELFELGKKASFDEHYYDIKIENQDIAPVGPFEHPELTFSFKKGYERGIFLIEKNIVPDEYKNINNGLTK